MVNVRMVLKEAKGDFFLALHACELWVYIRGIKPHMVVMGFHVRDFVVGLENGDKSFVFS